MADCVAVVSHFGYAPQRLDSKKTPYGRVALKVRQAYSAVARVAETGDDKYKAAAKRFLHMTSGQHTSRLLLAGMIADLTHEFSKYVHSGDFNNPDPMRTARAANLLHTRNHVLFIEGLILCKSSERTFTGQILKFLSKPQIVDFEKKAVVLSIGELADDDVLFEPLNRMRLVVKSIKTLMDAARPDFTWEVRFLAFRLPSPLRSNFGAGEMEPEEVAALRVKVRRDLRAILDHDRSLDADACMVEVCKLASATEAHRRHCATLPAT